MIWRCLVELGVRAAPRLAVRAARRNHPFVSRHLRDFVIPFALLLTVGLSAPGTPACASDSFGGRPPALIALRPDAPGDLHAFAKAIRALGGRVAVAYPPRTAVILAGDDLLRSPALRAWIREAHRGSVGGDGLAGSGPEAARAARAWNAALNLPKLPPSAAGSMLPGAPLPDARRVPVPLDEHRERKRAARAPSAPGASPAASPDAGYYDTSEYMAGSVAVGVWLLESAGSAYDWTQDEVDQTLAGIQAALVQWAVVGGDAAFLTFYLDIHTGVPISGDPIVDIQNGDSQWVAEALASLGYTGTNGYQECYDYNNSIRDGFGTDWCYSIFVVDSDPNVNQGRFTGGGYAWAYLGGPWVFMSRFSTWAYNGGEYWAAVPMHETGHIFLATDEYDDIQVASGYLDAPDDTTHPNCVMNMNDTTQVCQATRNQLGWRDLDANGIIEPLDTSPSATLASASDSTSERSPVWTGVAEIVPLPNLNPFSYYSPPHAISVATIDRVEVRVDHGPWNPATPLDGAFDSHQEAFTWTAPPLCDGWHIAEARARSSVGDWTVDFVRDSVYIVPAGVDCGPRVTAPDSVAVDEGAQLGVQVTASDPEGEPIALLAADLSALPAGNNATFVSDAAQTSGTLTWTPSYNDSGSYEVVFTASNILTGSAPTKIRVRNRDRGAVVTAPATFSGGEGLLIEFTVGATDPDGDAIRSLTASGFPPPATFTTSTDMTAGTFSWVPFYTQAGSYPVTFRATNALVDSATTWITVADRPPAPVVTAPDTAQTAASLGLTFSVTAVDPDGDVVSLKALGLPQGAKFADQGDNTGVFDWTPVEGDADGSPYLVIFQGTNSASLSGSDSTVILVSRTPTGIALSLVDAEVTRGRVRIHWHLAGDGWVSTSVYRCAADSVWALVGQPSLNGTHEIVWEDGTVAAGMRYGYRLVARGAPSGESTIETWVSVPAGRPAPSVLRLEPVRPNPVGGRAELSFGLPRPGRVRLVVYDVQGRRVATLVDGFEPIGWMLVTWDGRDSAGREVASGTYFVRLDSGGSARVGKLVVAR